MNLKNIISDYNDYLNNLQKDYSKFSNLNTSQDNYESNHLLRNSGYLSTNDAFGPLSEVKNRVLKRINEKIRSSKEDINRIKKIEPIYNSFMKKYENPPESQYKCLRCGSSHPADKEIKDKSIKFEYVYPYRNAAFWNSCSYEIIVWECKRCQSKYYYYDGEH